MATNPGQELSSINFGSLIGGPLCAVIEAQTQAARATADFIKTVGFDTDNKPVYVAFKYPKELAPYQPAVPAQVIVENPGTVEYTSPPTLDNLPTDVTATVILKDKKVARVELSGTSTAAVTVQVSGNVPADRTKATLVWVPGKDAEEPVYRDMKLEVPILTMLPIPFIRIDEATIDFNAKINSMETASESSDMAISGNQSAKQRWPGGAAKLNVSTSYQKKTSTGATVERTYSMQVHVRASQDEMPAGMEKLLSLLEGAMKATPLPP